MVLPFFACHDIARVRGSRRIAIVGGDGVEVVGPRRRVRVADTSAGVADHRAVDGAFGVGEPAFDRRVGVDLAGPAQVRSGRRERGKRRVATADDGERTDPLRRGERDLSTERMADDVEWSVVAQVGEYPSCVRPLVDRLSRTVRHVRRDDHRT
jgi:hypothetical protein